MIGNLALATLMVGLTVIIHFSGLLALVITLVAIRVRREDLPDGPVVM